MEKNCLVCGEIAEVKRDPLKNISIVDCHVCGKYVFSDMLVFPDKPSNINKLAHYLYYDRIMNQASDLTNYNYICSKAAYEKFIQDGYKGIHVTNTVIEDWYPKSFSEKIDMILLGLSKQIKFHGDSISLTKPQTTAILFADYIDENGNQVPVSKQVDFIAKHLQEKGYIERINLEAPCFSLKTPALERVDKLTEAKSEKYAESKPEYNDKQIYANFLQKISESTIDDVEKSYIREACQCAQNGLRLSAMTMLGCAAECLLLQLCQSYLSYLQNGFGSKDEIDNFKAKAINAKKASARLDVLRNTIQNKESVFKSLGLEKANLHMASFDLLRQVRNDSGHPTGTIVSNEDMNTFFTNYQLLFDRIHQVIKKLPLLRM